MLYRKIEDTIQQHLTGNSDKILIVTGARQVGKSFIIRHVGQRLYPNFIELNFVDDANGPGIFRNVRTTDDFYLTLSSIAPSLGNSKDTLIFFDEIQVYPQFMTMLKFLRQEHRFSYIASGSLLGVTLKQTLSVPVGSIEIIRMYPLDFEEFLIANNVNQEIRDAMRRSFETRESLPDGVHTVLMSHFRRYLIVGGLPDSVNTYLDSHNIIEVRKIQNSIHELYAIDASQYDIEHRLKITKLYETVPSLMENIRKRLIFKNIEGKTGARAAQFEEELDYLTASGIVLETTAVSNPKFPLTESMKKNLLKLYMNDVGILSGLLYRNNIRPIIDDESSINLGSVYETAVAMELAAHGNRLFYYDNKSHGEVDFLADNFQKLTVSPIEVKSGKDYKVHSALTRFLATPDYNIKEGYVLSNIGKIEEREGVVYLPVYYAGFFTPDTINPADQYF